MNDETAKIQENQVSYCWAYLEKPKTLLLYETLKIGKHFQMNRFVMIYGICVDCLLLYSQWAENVNE